MEDDKLLGNHSMMRSDEKCGKGGGTCEKRCFVTVVQQSKYGLGCLTDEVPRSHTIRHTNSSPLHK